MDFAPYKKAVKDTVSSNGVEVQLSFAPSRVITTLTKYVKEGKLVASSLVLENAPNMEWFAKDEYGRMAGVKPEFMADKAESAKIIEDFLRAIALLTDKEMMERVAAAAPRKKDGHLTANRYAVSFSMDGLFQSGESYVVGAKSDKNDAIEITVTRTKPNQYASFATQTADFLAANKDIAERMGLA